MGIRRTLMIKRVEMEVKALEDRTLAIQDMHPHAKLRKERMLKSMAKQSTIQVNV